MEEDSAVEGAIAVWVGIDLCFIDRATCGDGTSVTCARRCQCLEARGARCRARLRRDTVEDEGAHARKEEGKSM